MKKIMILIGVGISISVFSQFNTITPIVVKEKKPTNEMVQKEKDNTVEIKTKKNKKKSLFNKTTKEDLKREIDSLKTMMIKQSLSFSGKKKIDFEKIEDSLIFMLKNRIQQFENKNYNPNIQQFSLIKDEVINNSYKIFMPVKKELKISSYYGTRTHPIFGTKKFHNGIDIPISYESVYSVLDGIVTESGWDSKGGGNYIKINHFNKFETAYLHLSQIYYKVGEYVKAGFVIAKSGNSGNSTGPHLHFSVKENGKFINPSHFLNDLIKANNLIATYNGQ